MLVAQMLRKYCASPFPVPNGRARMSARKLQLVRDYIHSGLASRLTLEDLASSIHMSAYHFARAFKATTGETPHGYVTRVRVERAQELLRTSSCSMPAIAARVGFSSKSHFAAVFLRLTGISPHLYRSATRSATSDEET
jgi:AraC family transcriptional regulator